MLKFKTANKGTITQGVNQNLNPLYKEKKLTGHTGIDWTKGYGTLVPVDNDGYVYKVFKPQQLDSNWTGVYMIVPYGDLYMEVCMGHFSEVFVREGDNVLEGTYIAKEGNYGDVYSGGVKITPEMQDAGDKRGSHVHESYRPVRRVKKTKRGEFYLDGSDGKKYKDEEGYYYEIVEKNNGINGCIDPLEFHYIETASDKARCFRNVLIQTLKQLTK